MTKPDVIDREWHLDKKVPIALILAIVVQTSTIVWWGARLDARVGNLEKGDETRVTKESQLNSIAIDIAVLKENVKTTKDDISSMKTGFDMLMQQVLQEKAAKR